MTFREWCLVRCPGSGALFGKEAQILLASLREAQTCDEEGANLKEAQICDEETCEFAWGERKFSWQVCAFADVP